MLTQKIPPLEQVALPPAEAPLVSQPSLDHVRTSLLAIDNEQITSHFLKEGYLLAREIGDKALGALATPRAQKLLTETAEAATPQSFLISIMNEHEGEQSIASHDEWFKVLRVDETVLAKPKKGAGFHGTKVQPRQKGDVELVAYMDIMAHETAHAMLAGISDRLTEEIRDSNWDYHYATRAYLSRHPEHGISMNWESDVAIHEERFAEGYAKLVLNSVLNELGYNPRERKAILESARIQERVYGLAGENQIDHLRAANRPSSLAELSTSQDSELLYSGILGYAHPLTPKEVASQLDELAGLSEAGPRSVVVNAGWWHRQVKKHQLLENQQYVYSLRHKRFKELRQQGKERRQKTTDRVVNVVGVGALATVGLLFPEPWVATYQAVNGDQLTRLEQIRYYNEQDHHINSRGQIIPHDVGTLKQEKSGVQPRRKVMISRQALEPHMHHKTT